METKAPILEMLENRRLFSVAIGSITAETVVAPGSTPDSVDRHARARLSAQGVTASPGDRAVAVTYFSDVNGDGTLNRGDKVIAKSHRAERNFAIERFIRTGRALEAFPVSAVAHGRFGRDDVSPVVTQGIAVVNAVPTIRRMKSSPHRVRPDGKLIVSAHVVKARDGLITQVAFFKDVNRDGRIDSGDVNIGTGTRRRRSHAWRIDAAPAMVGEVPGSRITFLAQATDATGGVSSADAPPSVTVTVV